MVLGGERARIPDYRIYRVEDAPELQSVQDALASKGLRDPWMRNEVWRYLESEWGTHRQRLLTFFFRGFRLGFGAFLATIALENVGKFVKGGDGGGGGDGGHNGGDGGGHDAGGNIDVHKIVDGGVADIIDDGGIEEEYA